MKNESAYPAEDMPDVAVKQRRGFSIVWLIPLVAGVIAIWLAYKTISEEGPTITITFKTAEGLEAGKTSIKYRDVTLGQVDTVELTDDLSHVVVTASLDSGAEGHLTEGTQFWVVRPRLSAAGVSGLGTLISGAYIEMDPGKGSSAREFTGLEVPPLVRSTDPGRKYVLQAESLGSVAPGSPVYFRGIDVGEVLGYELAESGSDVTIYVFVAAPYDKFVRDDSHFWNASGIDVSMGAGGVNVSTESLQALLAGGIAFDTPLAATQGKPSEEGARFKLFDNLASVQEASFTDALPYLLQFDGSVRGLEVGAPVEFRGIKVGEVTDVSLRFDAKNERILIPVTIEIERDRIVPGGVKAMAAPPPPYSIAEKMVERGLRAQLQTGSLLTGQLLVNLDFYPNSPPATLKRGGKYPEIPTIPSNLAKISESATQIMDKIARLPLDGLATDVRSLLESLQGIATSPELRETLQALRETAKSASAFMTEAQSTMATADGLIGRDSELRYDLTSTFAELKSAARSIRQLADYLERHPDSLLYGKSGANYQ